jgi:hypothetical protein
MWCSYGYVQPSYDSEYCITRPDNALAGAYEGANYGYRCVSGYTDIDGQCIKECKSNQFFRHSSSECVNIPKYAYKTSYDDYECHYGYEYHQAFGVQRCVKSCTENEIMDTTTYACKSKYTKEFIKYCIVRDSIECKNGYDYYYINGMITAKKLPEGASKFNNDGSIQSCSELYKNVDNKCVSIVTPTFADHCFIQNQGTSYDASASCDEKWDDCKQNGLYHAVKLPANAATIGEDCVTIVGCEYDYKLDSNMNKCVQ